MLLLRLLVDELEELLLILFTLQDVIRCVIVDVVNGIRLIVINVVVVIVVVHHVHTQEYFCSELTAFLDLAYWSSGVSQLYRDS